MGKRLGVADNATGNNVMVWREIIGVVGDVEPVANLAHPPTRQVVYRPIGLTPEELKAGYDWSYSAFYRWGNIVTAASAHRSVSRLAVASP